MSDILTLPVLTPAQITGLLANTRDRGGHDRFVGKFSTAVETFNEESRPKMAARVTDDPQYKGKTVSSIKQGLAQAIKRANLAGQYKLLNELDDDGEVVGLIIVNMDEHAYRQSVATDVTDES